MTDKWILRKEDRLFDPVTLKTLRTWVYENRVDGRDMVSSDGGKTWTQAASTPELMFFFPSQTTSISEIPRGYSGKIERKRRSIEVIDMIPMIDMVFLLLIFFAVTNTFEMQRVMEMNMPETASGKKLESAVTLTVQINKLNQLFLDNEPIELQEFKTRLKKNVRDGGKLTVVIQADEQVHHGKVVELMDAANAAGVKKILITVKKKGP